MVFIVLHINDVLKLFLQATNKKYIHKRIIVAWEVVWNVTTTNFTIKMC